MKREGYVPQRFYNHDPVLRRCLDALRSGFRDGVRYDDLYQRLLFGAGGAPPTSTSCWRTSTPTARRSSAWRRPTGTRPPGNRMSLHNIARSGVFAADRAVAQYADNIWHVPYKGKK